MNLAEIKQLNTIEPYCFESSQEEEWYKCGLYEGAQIAERSIYEWLKRRVELNYSSIDILRAFEWKFLKQE